MSRWRVVRRKSQAHNWVPVRYVDGTVIDFPSYETALSVVPEGGLDASRLIDQYDIIPVIDPSKAIKRGSRVVHKLTGQHGVVVHIVGYVVRVEWDGLVGQKPVKSLVLTTDLEVE